MKPRKKKQKNMADINTHCIGCDGWDVDGPNFDCQGIEGHPLYRHAERMKGFIQMIYMKLDGSDYQELSNEAADILMDIEQ